jgi:peptide/nickel transport system ATP-binding protein/oligopeptide transport system ATP-binding protein
MTPAPILKVEGLTRIFSGREGGGSFGRRFQVRAVDGVSFTLMPGETLAIVGESGCGKSTLARLLLRLLAPSAGTLAYAGRDYATATGNTLRDIRRHIQMVFQDPYSSLSPRRTAGQIIAEPLEAYRIVTSAEERRARVSALLKSVGLRPEHADRYPAEFSGGQRQRIGIARAIAVEPDVIVADEPVSALDVSVQAQIINLLQDLQARTGVALIFIAHDLAVVRHIADRVAVMYLGQVVEIGPKRQIYSAPQHPYTDALLSAVPRPDPGARTGRVLLEGDLPSPTEIIAGCAFASRCPIVRDRCKIERPLLREVAEAQSAACHFATPQPLAASRRHAIEGAFRE